MLDLDNGEKSYPLTAGCGGRPLAALDATVQVCLRRVRHWRVPGNWSHRQWMEEISEQAMLAAIVELAPDAAAELPRNSRRVRSHIQNALLQRYRQEWSFNRRFGGRIVGEPAQPDDADRDSLFNGQALHAALAALSASDRQLIAQLYWENRTESQIAAEAGVSVPAICKHKRRIFRDLAENLKNIKL